MIWFDCDFFCSCKNIEEQQGSPLWRRLNSFQQSRKFKQTLLEQMKCLFATYTRLNVLFFTVQFTPQMTEKLRNTWPTKSSSRHFQFSLVSSLQLPAFFLPVWAHKGLYGNWSSWVHVLPITKLSSQRKQSVVILFHLTHYTFKAAATTITSPLSYQGGLHVGRHTEADPWGHIRCSPVTLEAPVTFNFWQEINNILTKSNLMISSHLTFDLYRDIYQHQPI